MFHLNNVQFNFPIILLPSSSSTLHSFISVLCISQYLQRFDLTVVFTEEDFRHWFVPRAGIIDSYVVEVRLLYFL